MNALQHEDSPLTIRRAVKADLDRLVVLLLALQDHIEASSSQLWRMSSEARSQLKGKVAARLDAQDSCVLVAEHTEHGVVGVIFGRVITNNRYLPSRAGSLDQLFVHEDHRRAGVGTSLVAGLCRFFADEGVDDLTLRYVVANDEAAGFWMTLGFSPRITTSGARRQFVDERINQRGVR